MSSLSLSNLISTGKTLGFVQDPSQRPFLGGNQHNFTSVVFLGSSRSNISFSTEAIIRKKGRRRHERPWPNHDQVDPEWKSEHLMHLSPYKPLKEKPKTINLQFEKPLLELRKNIRRVEKFAKTCPEDLSELVKKLRQRYKRVATQFYANLEPIEKVHIARHPQRPTFLDHVINMTDRWIELHGDRAGYDDPAIVCALGSMEGKTYMFIGHQKGRNSKENIKRNFGMPTPHGYRKALRFMYYAEQHGFPIITFVDTPGAFADLKSEELNQGEAIANNLRSMFGLKVPIVSVVIGEGGSGGALAIACANKLLMLQNAVFFVASPEACAAILYKSAKKAPKAAKNLRITADGLQTMGVCDGIIPEPLGGAHRDHIRAAQLIKGAVLKAMEELREMEMGELLDNRKLKFRKIGAYQELDHIDPIKTRKMKKREVPYSAFNLVQPTPSDKKLLEAALKDVKSEFSEEDLEELLSDEFFFELQEEVYQEFVKALESLELTRKAHALNMQFLSWLKRTKLSPRLQELLLKLPNKDSPPSPSELKEMHAFFRTLAKPGGYDMQYKVEYLLSEFLPLVSRPENAIELKESYHALCAVRTLRYHLKGSKGVKEDEGDMNSLWLTEKAVNEEFGDAFEKFKLKEEFDGLNEEILALGERPKLSPSTQKMVRRLLLKHRGKVSSFKSASELKEAYSSFCDVRRLSFHLKEREDEKVKTNNVADAKVAVKA